VIVRVITKACLVGAVVLGPMTAVAQQSFSSRFPGASPEINEAPFQRDYGLSCRFETECFEADACQDTAFVADFSGKAGGLNADAMALVAKLSSDAGEVELFGAAQGEILALSGGPVTARHMLTLSGSAARYSVHYSDGPLMISYSGICE